MRFSLRNIVFVSGILVAFGSLPSCDKLYFNYLQADYQLPEVGYLSTENEINIYTDSLKSLLPFSKEFKSMIYSLGDYSFQVRKYMYKGQPLLYIESGDNGEYGKTENHYYIKDGKLTLVVENFFTNTGPKSFTSRKIYFNEGKMMYAEQRSGLNRLDVQSKEYEKTDLPVIDHIAQLTTFEDALNKRGRFDLVFEGITEYPKAKYLIFSKKEINAYRAPIKVENEDEFIHELFANPLRYKGEKLDINWNINGLNEAVYLSGKLQTRD